jgi:hypothetical protein
MKGINMPTFELNPTAETPSAGIIRNANKTGTVTDALGRVITVKKLSALDRMRLFAFAGPELSTNEPWIGMAALAFAVTGVGDDQNVRPNSLRELEAHVERLGDDGLEAAARAYAQIAPAREDVTAVAKN